VAIAVELLGGLALLAGFKTRQVALILGAFTVVTAIFFHHDFADQMQMVMFLKNLAITGGLLFVAVFGPGKISVDRR
jgi:putative oxidoreductase